MRPIVSNGLARASALVATAIAAALVTTAVTAPLLAAQTLGPTAARAANLDTTARRPVAAVIDDYVKLGLSSNLALQSAELEVERTAAALDSARARFSPEASLVARYTRAEGGREISLPLAAAFNPVYLTLNDLLKANGQAPRFGTIQDPQFSLIRPREQDTRVTLRQPLYAPAIPAAVRAQRAALEASRYAQLALTNRLRRDITASYVDWSRAARAADLVVASRLLLAENLRITESLYANGKLTQDQVLRAKAELLALDQQVIEVQNVRDQARSYLNFLLNRPLDTTIEASEVDTEIARTNADLAQLRTAAITARPELAQADRAIGAAGARASIARAARMPSLALAVDGGTQGERYEFGSGRNFSTVSLLLNWTLFDGGARSADERAARISERQARTQREQLALQIELEVQQALDRLRTSTASLETAAARAAAAQAAFRIATRKRDEGMMSQLEFLDARTSLSAAELNLNALRYEVLARQADLDYATGGPRR